MLTSLSLAPYNLFLINFISFPLFFLFLVKKLDQKKDLKLFFFYGWLFGFGYFLTNLYWISISLTFDQNLKYLIPLVVIIIPSFLGLFFGIVSYLFSILKTKNIISSFFIFSLIFGVIEFIRGSILTGFPWNLIAFSFSNQLELLSITSILGTYGFNLFCISLFTSPALIVLRKSGKEISIFFTFIIIFISFYSFGHFYNKNFYKAESQAYEYKIKIIGSNISLDRFYLNTDINTIIEDLIKLSDPKKNEKTIFIWPEGMFADISREKFSEYSFLFEEKFNENHILITGTNNQTSNNRSKNYFNSLSVYDNELNLLDSYNKINLVPFGEFLPFKNILDKTGLKPLTNNYQSFSKGDLREIIEIKKKNFSLRILPLICYEIIYSGNLFDSINFDLIINISEDGWFGKSIGPKQHFDHSIFRAIESGKYILRSANNGIAAIINPVGVVEKSVKFGQTGYVELNKTREIQPTIFSKYGNKIFGLLILMYIFLVFSFNKIKDE